MKAAACSVIQRLAQIMWHLLDSITSRLNGPGFRRDRSMGRPFFSEFESDIHTHQQAAVVTQCGVLTDKAVNFLPLAPLSKSARRPH